jgi:tetratricopeptide (TPR) repeat protein/CHAT domain-containing protein
MGVFDWLRGGPKKTTAELLAEAHALVAAGKFADAVTLFERVPRRDRTAAVLAETGWAYLGAGNTMAAVECAAEARQADPKCAEALCIQGEVLLREGRSGDATDRFREAVTIDPHCERAKRRLEELAPARKPEDQRRATDAAGERTGERDAAWATARLGELSDPVAELQAQGKYQIAIPLAREAVAFAEKHLGHDHPQTATCINNLGFLLHAAGDYAGARPYYERALEINRRVLGDNHPETATSLNNLGFLLHTVGDYAGARPYYRQALEIRKNVLGLDHPDTAASLNNVGGLISSGGDHAGARPYYEKALEINRRVLGNEHPTTAKSLDNLASLLEKAGDYAGALAHYEQALGINRRVLGEGHPDTATCLSKRGELLYTMGDYAGAGPCFEQALEIRKSALGLEHPATATSLNNLGFLRQRIGDYAGARPCFEQALEIRRRVFGEDHPRTATSLNSLGALLSATGDYTGAAAYHTRALEINRRASGGEHVGTAVSLNNMGALLSARGDHAGARPYFEQALEITEKVLGEDHPDTAACLNSLGCLYVCLGLGSDAWHLTLRAAQTDDRMIGRVFSVGSEAQRRVFLDTLRGNLAALLSVVTSHLAHSPEVLSAALDVLLKRKALGVEALAAQRDAILSGRHPRLGEQLKELSTLRTQVTQKSLAGPGPEGPEAHTRFLSESAARRDHLEAELARQIPEMRLDQRLRAADRRAVALALGEGVVLVEFVRFREFDFRAVPARGESHWKPARYLAFVLRAGVPDVEMVDLGEADPIDLLIADFRDAVGTSPAERLDRDMTRRVGSPTTPVDGVGALLRAAVFDKLVPALDGGTRLLLSPDGQLARLPFAVLPTHDGRLLADDYHISYIGSGRDVLRFSTPLARSQPALVVCDPDFDLGSETESIAPIGRSSRDLRSGLTGVKRLPGTRSEGRTVGELLGVDPWYGAAGLKKSLLACQSPRVLHLATHGFFLEDQDETLDRELWRRLLDGGGQLRADVRENPLLRSGLVLAGVNTFLHGGKLPEDADNGLLTALDVTGMDLLGTELVVLSACQTGEGDVQVGEGVIGLQRAFTIAGARTLVMSLWGVDDVTTYVLMVRLYRQLLAGGSKADALREAQNFVRDVTVRELRSDWLIPEVIDHLAAGNPDARADLLSLVNRPDDDRPFADPYYWGAFILQGDPGPLGPNPS